MSLLAESAPASNVAEYTVSEISGALKRTVEDTFGHVRVRGEISGYRGPHSSGHAYFCLKDDKARMDAVVWRTSFSKLSFKPQEGLEIVATGKLTTYPGASKYQIVIDDIQPAGAGALMALLDERRRKLEAEGLFAAERKKPLPLMPNVIGIVTSPTGAVIRDICHRIADRFPVHLLVWPVRVQGETSGDEVARAIEGFNAIEPGGKVPRPDLLIVARGGGSLEDLWGFNDEAVVRAAAASQIPLISAVGHETDWTLIDHAADRRAPTPTGAAEMAVPVKAELVAAIASLHARHGAAVSRRLDAERRHVAATARALPAPDMLLALPRRRLDEATTSLGQCLRVAITDKRRAYAEIAARLSPSSLDGLARDKRAALRHLSTHVDHAVRVALDERRRRFERVAAELKPHALRARSEAARVNLDRLGERLALAETRLGETRRQRLGNAWRMAGSLDPRRVLERGYAIVRDAGNVPIVRASGLEPGMAFQVEFAGRQIRHAVATGEDGQSTPPPDRPKRARQAAAPAGEAVSQADGVPEAAPPAPRRRRAAAKKAAEGQGSLF
ncbi:exodeoxyribonuclease VII large subunit [Jiella sp. M17.18]|uniref:exodeoxyribonuclease VII large subunit n=1 Tax=Jiella sp. M17.18 TaxID=3234247 RepID=UPI0034DE884D